MGETGEVPVIVAVFPAPEVILAGTGYQAPTEAKPGEDGLPLAHRHQSVQEKATSAEPLRNKLPNERSRLTTTLAEQAVAAEPEALMVTTSLPKHTTQERLPEAPAGYMNGYAFNVSLFSAMGISHAWEGVLQPIQLCDAAADCVGVFSTEIGSWRFLKPGLSYMAECCSDACRQKMGLSDIYCVHTVYEKQVYLAHPSRWGSSARRSLPSQGHGPPLSSTQPHRTKAWEMTSPYLWHLVMSSLCLALLVFFICVKKNWLRIQWPSKESAATMHRGVQAMCPMCLPTEDPWEQEQEQENPEKDRRPSRSDADDVPETCGPESLRSTSREQSRGWNSGPFSSQPRGSSREIQRMEPREQPTKSGPNLLAWMQGDIAQRFDFARQPQRPPVPRWSPLPAGERDP